MTRSAASATDRAGHALLLVGRRSYRAQAFLHAIRQAGLSAIVVSDQESAIAHLARGRTLAVDPDDADDPDRPFARIVEHARAHTVRAVLAPDDDLALLAARVAAALGLPGHPVEAVRAANDKLATRRACAAHDVRAPWFQALPRDGRALAAVAENLRYPCVLKPTGLAAGLGVIRADDARALLAAATTSRAISERFTPPARRHDIQLMAEGFLPGREVIVEAVLCRGVWHTLAVLDKPDAGDGPYFPETLLITPSRLAPADIDDAVRQAARCAAAVGLEHGPVHAELRVHDGRATLIELAARTIGGRCSPVIALASGHSLESLVVRVALGRAIDARDTRPAPGSRGVMMLPVPRAGVLEAVHGADTARAVPGIEEVLMTAHVGAHIAPAPYSDRYLGFLLAAADTPAEVEHALRRAHACLDFAVAPSPARTTRTTLTR